MSTDVHIRPLEEREIDEADRIMRLAFGTFLKMPDPMQMFGDATFTKRWYADPGGALAAEADGRLIGSNFVANWGSFGFFGPLSVLPELWERKIAQRMLEETMALFRKWGMRHTGLFTFPESPKHAALYQKFGFWSRFLTPLMEKKVERMAAEPQFLKFSEGSADEKAQWIQACREVTDSIYDGLDVTIDIQGVDRQRIGETVMLTNGSRIASFAVCHVGAGTEAGSDCCYVKFGAVRSGNRAAEDFDRLLAACEALAVERSVSEVNVGVNMGRHQAYRALIARGYRTYMHGVAMEQGNAAGYNRPGVFVIDDWR
jgi:N-acetylglutamate synthase-like GNAT family acetyltransferase